MTYKPESKTKMYKGYEVLNKADIEDNLDSMLTILHRAKEEMVKPLMFHFIVEIISPDDVPSKIVQAVKEKFTSEINKNHKVRKANPDTRQHPVAGDSQPAETRLQSRQSKY